MRLSLATISMGDQDWNHNVLDFSGECGAKINKKVNVLLKSCISKVLCERYDLWIQQGISLIYLGLKNLTGITSIPGNLARY
jgi:hypothetical protein